MRFPASTSAVLHRNVAHRAACLALYRRLLKHVQNIDIQNLPLPTPPPPSLQKSLKSIITREFKAHTRRDIPLPTLRAALTLAHKAEKCLRLATKPSPDAVELARLSSYITLHRQKRNTTAHDGKPLVRMQSANITVQPTPKPRPPKPVNPSVLKLPRELRFKPTIIGGNVIPFVRYTGTRQSQLLSGVLNKKLKRKLKRDELQENLRLDREYANAEDVFEANLWAEAGKEWRREHPEENPARDGYWKTEVVKAQMEIQLKQWAHQVEVWNRSGECMEVIEEHKRKVKEFMGNLKEERLKEKNKGMVVEGKVEETDTRMDALDRQLEEAGLGVVPRTAAEPARMQRVEREEIEYTDSVESQMEALNAQLEAAGFTPTPPTTKPRKSGDYRTETTRKRDTRTRDFGDRYHTNKRADSPRKDSYAEPRPRRTSSPGRQDVHPRHHEKKPKEEERKETWATNQHDNGAMLAGKGKRSHSMGLDLAKVFGAEEPGSRAVKTRANAVKSRPYERALDDIFEDPWSDDKAPAESQNSSYVGSTVGIDDELRNILGR